MKRVIVVRDDGFGGAKFDTSWNMNWRPDGQTRPMQYYDKDPETPQPIEDSNKNIGEYLCTSRMTGVDD